MVVEGGFVKINGGFVCIGGGFDLLVRVPDVIGRKVLTCADIPGLNVGTIPPKSSLSDTDDGNEDFDIVVLLSLELYVVDSV